MDVTESPMVCAWNQGTGVGVSAGVGLNCCVGGIVGVNDGLRVEVALGATVAVQVGVD